MSYPIITTTENQVLIDDTRGPKENEWYLAGKSSELVQNVFGDEYSMKSYNPILASRYPIHNSILLLPGDLWENTNRCETILKERLKHALPVVRGTFAGEILATEWFKAGYEAAGGWTDEDMIAFVEWVCEKHWIRQYSPSGRFWEKGAERKSSPELLQVFLSKRGPLRIPIALEVETETTCPDCGGDGIETCHNPDHGFLRGVVNIFRSAGESACPCCGHDSEYKIRKNKCETCKGLGVTSIEAAISYADECGYDDEITERFKTIPHPATELNKQGYRLIPMENIKPIY